MAQQELRPAWCGSLADQFSWPEAFVRWENGRGRAFCCRECADIGRRVGWHSKTLGKERAEGRAERNRLARKVNALLRQLTQEREHADSQERLVQSYAEAMNVRAAESAKVAMENEALRRALEDLGQKNDGLVMQVAELSGDLEDSRRWNDEERFKHDHERAALLGRIVESFSARAILEGFVFEVLDQYAESQQQLASNR